MAYIDYSLKNGLGRPSVSIYLSGCDKPVKCKNCHNWGLHDTMGEIDFDKLISDVLDRISFYKQFNSDLTVSILGGDPLTVRNREVTKKLASEIKKRHNLDIVLYTWRTKLKELVPYIENIDYGVLGGYESSLHQQNVIPSSSNQVIYDFKKEQQLKEIKLKGDVE